MTESKSLMRDYGFIELRPWFDLAMFTEKPSDGKWFFTREELVYVDKAGNVWTVPIHTRTDFASIPKGLRWWISRVGTHWRAAVLHDWLCNKKIVPRKEADKLFKEAMESLKVSWFKRRIMYSGVRAYSIVSRKK